MSWKLALLGTGLVLTQVPGTDPVRAATAHGIVVEVGHSPMHGQWYQDGITHLHDKVRVVPVLRPGGSIDVTVGTGGLGGTDITFVFSHDESGRTRATATALVRSDMHAQGQPSTRRLGELEGRILVQSNDWGPGKTLNATFAIRGRVDESAELLLGSFSVLLRD